MNKSSSTLEKSKKTEHYKKLFEYRENLIKEAEEIVLNKFPKKVAEFNAILASNDLSYDNLYLPDLDKILPVPESASNNLNDSGPNAKRVKAETGTPVFAFTHGRVPCNAKLATLMDQIRPQLREAVEDVNKIKVWIQFLIPRIEDGNNFGVSIQEECLNEVRNVEGEAASFLDQMSRYFLSRAKLITKCAKYPHVDDYRRAILDTDEKQFLNIRLVAMEMRNHYAALHDVLTKNLDKIKKPRNNTNELMY